MATSPGNSPRAPQRRSGQRLTRPQIIAIVGIILAAAIALIVPFVEPAADIWIRNLLQSGTPTPVRGQFTDTPQPNSEPQNQQLASFTPSPSEPTTEVFASTATFTEAPSFTPTNTSTVTFTPIAPGTVLFEDNFDQGLSPNWTVIFGDPIIAQGQLSGNGRTFISVGDVSWKNYEMSIKVRLGYTKLKPDDPPQVIPRFTDPENYIGYKLNMWSWKAVWVEAKNGAEWTPIPNSENYGMKTFEWHTFQMKVEDKKYTVYVDGIKVSQLISDQYPNGGVGFLLDTIILIDDIKVVALP